MSALRALPARRSASSSHANSTVSDVCVTCSSLPSVRRSYFPPLRRLLLLPPLLQQPNRQPLAINKHKEGKKKEGVVGVTSVAADGRTDARTEGRTEGAPTYKLPSVKPEPDVRLRRAVPSLVITEQLFKTCILIAAELQPGEVSCCLSLLLHLSRPPSPKKLVSAIVEAVYLQCWPAACRLLKMATANGRGWWECVCVCERESMIFKGV